MNNGMYEGDRHSNWLMVDGRWSGMGGIGRFSDEVLKRLSSTVVLKGGPKPTSPLGGIWGGWCVQRIRPKIFFTPGFNPAVGANVANLCVIHDLIHLRFPREQRTVKTLYYENIIAPAIRKAGLVLTVSKFSRGEIAEWLHFDPERIAVAYNGVGPEFCPEGNQYDLGFPYALYVGNQRPHKNVVGLLNAIARLRHASDLHLVLLGSPTSETKRAIEDLLIRSRVHFLKHVSERDLPALYRGAQVCVLPSLYEGFGLPVIEAMACGTPVAASGRTSIPEIAGNAAVFFNPEDIDEMADSIDRSVSDSSLRHSLRCKGLERSQEFAWNDTAQIVQNTIDSLHRQLCQRSQP